jgi:hypothetical protein
VENINTWLAFLLFIWVGNWYLYRGKVKAAAKKAATSDAAKQIGGALLTQALKRINKF